MKAKHLKKLEAGMEQFLGDFDEDGGNPEWCYENLHKDMAKAAAAVYEACMAGQKFAREQQRS